MFSDYSTRLQHDKNINTIYRTSQSHHHLHFTTLQFNGHLLGELYAFNALMLLDARQEGYRPVKTEW